MRTNERVAQLGAASMEDDILIGNIAHLNDIDFVKMEVKYHRESQSTTNNQIHFLNKIVILLGLKIKKNIYFRFFYE